MPRELTIHQVNSTIMILSRVCHINNQFQLFNMKDTTIWSDRGIWWAQCTLLQSKISRLSSMLNILTMIRLLRILATSAIRILHRLSMVNLFQIDHLHLHSQLHIQANSIKRSPRQKYKVPQDDLKLLKWVLEMQLRIWQEQLIVEQVIFQLVETQGVNGISS